MLSAPAWAADAREESRVQFRRGVELVKEENFRAAKDAFERAYGLFPHPSILLNLGTTRLKVGEWVQAERDLARFLSDDGGAPPEEIESARRALGETRTHLGTIRVQIAPSSAKVALDGKEVAVTPGQATDLRAPLGAHEITATLDGYGTEKVRVEISSPALPVEIRRTLSPTRGHRRAPEETGYAGYAFAGAGVVALGAGIFSGLRARSLASDYNTPGSGAYQSASTRSEGVTFRTVADVSFVVAVVSLAAGAYFLFLSPRGSTAHAAVGSP